MRQKDNMYFHERILGDASNKGKRLGNFKDDDFLDGTTIENKT